MQQPVFLRGRGVAAAAAVCAVLTVTACSAAGPAVRAARPGAVHGCKAGVWAEKVTDAGRTAWQVSLPADAALKYAGDEVPAPLAVGGLSLFPDGDALYALRLSDGHTAWHRAFSAAGDPAPGTVNGLWAWHGSVIALIGAASGTASLVSLNPATGAVRWRAGLGPPPGSTVIGGGSSTVWLTSDGVAVAAIGAYKAVTGIDLAAGKRLWSRAYPRMSLLPGGSATLAVAGTTLVAETQTPGKSSAVLTGLRARTGATLWSRTGFPPWAGILPAPGGRIMVAGVNNLQTPAGYPVTALSAATGKTLWQLKPQGAVSALWPQGNGLVIASSAAGKKETRTWLSLADLATGRVRWSGAGSPAADGHPIPADALIATDGDVLTFAASLRTDSVVDSAARTGATRWTVPAVVSPSSSGLSYLASPQGPDVLASFPGASAGKPSRLLAIDEATGKTAATVPLPYTAALIAMPGRTPDAITVIGGDALLEPEQITCTRP